MRKHVIGKSLEKRVAKKVGGNVTIGSGNLWFDKEDVKSKDWLIQTKATDKDFYTLKVSDINKVIVNARLTHRKWAFVVEFNSGDFLNRSCFIGISLDMADTVLDAELSRDMIVVEGKQFKMKKEELEDNWLEDEFVAYFFKKDNVDIVFLNEQDFVKLFIKVIHLMLRIETKAD